MLRQLLRLTRTSARRFREAVGEPTDRQDWLRETRKLSRVHETIEFIGLPPTRERVAIGAGGSIDRDVSIWLSNDEGADPRLAVGAVVYIGRNVFFGCYQPITIGDHTMIGAYVYFTSGDHRFDRRDIPMHLQGFEGASIQIGSDVWIGTQVTVLPGIKIGNGAVIGAGSVVTRSIPEYEIWAGVPARFIRKRPG